MTKPDTDDVADVLRSHPEPVLAMRDVLDALEERDMGASDTYVREHLRVLKRTGEAESKDVGARATAWWHTERVLPPTPEPEDHPDQAELDDVDVEKLTGVDEERPNVVEGVDGETVAVEQNVADLWTWMEGRPPRKSHGKQALADVFRVLLEAGGRPVATGELKDVVYSGERVEQWSSERSAWESVRRYLSDVPGVESTGGGEWVVDVDEAGRGVEP